MANLTALNLLPQEQLNLACLQEARELNRYRGLALSFLPFDPSVSRLMNTIGGSASIGFITCKKWLSK